MFKKYKEIKEQALNYRKLREEKNGLVKNLVILSRHENDLLEFENGYCPFLKIKEDNYNG